MTSSSGVPGTSIWRSLDCPGDHGLKVVRHILKLAATEWMDEFGLTWLTVAAKKYGCYVSFED